MQDKKISQLDPIVVVSASDYIPIVDVSDGAAGTTKKITIDQIGSSLTSINADLIDTGTLDNARLTSSVTLEGNTFNSASKLVKLDASTKLPAVDASLLTTLNASSISSGTVADARLSGNVTVQGNTFNGATQLIQTDSSSRIPALSGTLITNLNGTAVTSGTVADARLSSNVTLKANVFNGVSQLMETTAAGKIPALDGSLITNLNGTAITTGTVADARLTSAVTLMGNTFNGADDLVQLNSSGHLPTLNGSNLTNLAANNITTGTIADARLSSNVLRNNTALNGGGQTFVNYRHLTMVVSNTTFNVDNTMGALTLVCTNTIPVRINFADGLPEGFWVRIVTMGTDYVELGTPGSHTAVFKGGTITSIAPKALVNQKGLQVFVTSVATSVANTYVATGDIS
jgi:hypothetical protein